MKKKSNPKKSLQVNLRISLPTKRIEFFRPSCFRLKSSVVGEDFVEQLLTILLLFSLIVDGDGDGGGGDCGDDDRNHNQFYRA